MSPSSFAQAAAFLLVVGLTAGCGSSSPGPHRRAAPPHLTAVVLGQRIGPVSYGEPQAQITRTLGRAGPPVELHGQRFRGYPVFHIYVAYSPLGGVPGNAGITPPNPPHGGAALILTRSAQYKTDSGLGVGSTLQQLQQQVSQADCPIPTGMSNPTRCQYANATTGTVFYINPKTKRVSAVEIGPGGASRY